MSVKNLDELTEYTFGAYSIPPHMIGGIRDYIIRGRIPGSFLSAIFANDFVEACSRADRENLANLPAYAAFLYNEAPSGCWGSVEKVEAWRKSRSELSPPRPVVTVTAPPGAVHDAREASARRHVEAYLNARLGEFAKHVEGCATCRKTVTLGVLGDVSPEAGLDGLCDAGLLIMKPE